MPVPHTTDHFTDVVDPRFERIFDEEYTQHPDMIPTLMNMPNHNGRDDMRWSQIGSLADFSEFNGSVNYNAMSQGYDVTATYKEFTNGVQARRTLFDDDQYHILDQRPAALATSAHRTRQKHAARLFTMAFAVDNFFYEHSENVALCSNSHTTTSGASTASGFDNLTTAALSAVSVAAARIQMHRYRGDVAEVIDVFPNELWIPTELFEIANEITGSSAKLGGQANPGVINVHEGVYTIHEWKHMSDTKDWFMADGVLRKRFVHWIDRISLEFGMIEDFDTLVAKWRAYMRYAWAWIDWRWVLGAQVS